ncbi:hypothetical protein AVEN_81964-1 [Araneus ventricosus]|uniref:Uncharacterized protein n=1 Tax=Araneus ventricosus TaxID=182803 RepID=A0A4Y2IMC5_ARAVE|nr:hypothetical protein AVEN_81964-1 [Araneus ventricosus]
MAVVGKDNGRSDLRTSPTLRNSSTTSDRSVVAVMRKFLDPSGAASLGVRLKNNARTTIYGNNLKYFTESCQTFMSLSRDIDGIYRLSIIRFYTLLNEFMPAHFSK